ncbi:MAG: membrane protein insertion efficiency factor YidD [Candidatus Endonucleobacter bathymodioli]|uniref:Putative membrane protein insertion efficiency factor n=1 Tax=Candidatus Endonucleibacter bathymodioli TaxID=539814 RepID=A0AA90NTF8_9GAMM|nr:membrane protein insertion efficiency factor YidD [Candidatus Endonucleobacter bathymodioli]
MVKFSSIPKLFVVALIKFYCYFVSPLIIGRCRFYPTCSVFALGSIDRHGLLKGSFLACKRLLCCQPWHSGGFDPVPEYHSSNIKRQSHINPL